MLQSDGILFPRPHRKLPLRCRPAPQGSGSAICVFLDEVIVMATRLMLIGFCIALCIGNVFAQGLETTAQRNDWEEVNFEFDSDILSDGYPSLLRLADLLNQNPDYRVSILGHTDFRSSDMTSCMKVTGLTLPIARGDIGGWLRVVEALAIGYLTSRWTLCPRHREQYLRSSMRWVSLRRFLAVA